jgi:hypothetical protein
MGFADRYIGALGASNLMDDERHCQAEALAAAALADLSGGSGSVFGSMLARGKCADGVQRQAIESGSHALAILVRTWEQAVIRKGEDRKWLKIVHPWDVNALHGICRKIARQSLAHWLDGQCAGCRGTKITAGRACVRCADTPGREPVQGGALEREYVMDMISELEGLYQSHDARAFRKLREAA